MESNYKKLIDILAKSSLDFDEQNELATFFVKTREEDLKQVVDFLSENPTWVRKIYINYRIKKEVLSRGDRALWDRVLMDELKDLTEIRD